MGASRVWRKGRWYWYCTDDNGALDWKDHWRCIAQSRLTYTSEEEALCAGQKHTRSKGHKISTAKIEPPKWRTRK